MGFHHLGQLGPVLHLLSNAELHLIATIHWHVLDRSELLTASIETIAEWAGRSPRTIREMMDSLAELGVLDVVEPRTQGRTGVFRLRNFVADSSGNNAGHPRGTNTEPRESTPPTSRIENPDLADDPPQGKKQGTQKEAAADPLSDPDPKDHPIEWQEALADARTKGANKPELYAMPRFKEKVAEMLDKEQQQKRLADAEQAIRECNLPCFSNGLREAPDGMIRCDHTTTDDELWAAFADKAADRASGPMAAAEGKQADSGAVHSPPQVPETKHRDET